MTYVGADLMALRDLHKSFLTCADDAEHVRRQLDGEVSSAVWTSRYSDAFRQLWQDHRRHLAALCDELRRAAEDVRTSHNTLARAKGEPDRI